MGSREVAVVGEVLWDVFTDSELLGGAALNFAAHLSALGYHPRMISAVGNDERGREAVARMRALRVDTGSVGISERYPTGVVDVLLDHRGQPSFTIHRPAAYDDVLFPANVTPAEWIYFGTLLSMNDPARARLLKFLEMNSHQHRLYDVNLRKDSYTPEIVRQLLQQTDVLKLNESEVDVLREICGLRSGGIEQFCRDMLAANHFKAIAVTRGEQGCAVLVGGEYADVDGLRVDVADTVGAGDAFAAALLDGVERELPARQLAEFANRVAALIVTRRGGTPKWRLEDLNQLPLLT